MAVPAEIGTAGVPEVIAFGVGTDQLRRHAIEVGGFLVPIDEAPWQPDRGKDHNYHLGGKGFSEPGTRGPIGTRPGEGNPAPADPAPHAVQRGLAELLGINEVGQYHPDARWLAHSQSNSILIIPVRPFRSVTLSATLYFEVPTRIPAWMPFHPSLLEPVPFVRAWARWDTGIWATSHHQYPDQSMCVCRPEEWYPGRDTMEDYVSFAIEWVAKAMHESMVGRYPGQQHYSTLVRLQRMRVDEYCGCGSTQTYNACCLASDLAKSVQDVHQEHAAAQLNYLRELNRRGLPSARPLS